MNLVATFLYEGIHIICIFLSCLFHEQAGIVKKEHIKIHGFWAAEESIRSAVYVHHIMI